MIKSVILLSLVLLLSGRRLEEGRCDASRSGLIEYGHVQISLSGDVELSRGQDTQCYDYRLEKDFDTVPRVAIAVNCLESDSDTDFFFFIKPIHKNDRRQIEFVVRTLWEYTTWSKIQFSFIAEDRDDIEAGYYQVDSRILSNCDNGREFDVLLPFKDIRQIDRLRCQTFLHGFQISSRRIFGEYSPLEIQILHHRIEEDGIYVTVSTTTATQVHSIFVSYLVINDDFEFARLGNYIYEGFVSQRERRHEPDFNIKDDYTMHFYGLNGFIFNNPNSRNLALKISIDETDIVITSSTNYVYFSISYFFVLGGRCGQCRGSSIYYDDGCLSECPRETNYQRRRNTCMKCDDHQRWDDDDDDCVERCNDGRIWDRRDEECVCPDDEHWNGRRCIQCTGGRFFSVSSQECQCDRNQEWDGRRCVEDPSCSGGRFWDRDRRKCVCPDDEEYDGRECVFIPNCSGGRTYNIDNRRCECPRGEQWDGRRCIEIPDCSGGRFWDSERRECRCSSNEIWDGRRCVDEEDCSGGREWDRYRRECFCPRGEFWDNGRCTDTPSCSNRNEIWDRSRGECRCRSGYEEYRGECIRIPDCRGGQYYDYDERRCVCERGLNFNGIECTGCDGGRIFDSRRRQCVCPTDEYWDGRSCIRCSRDQYWDGDRCIRCRSGEIWNERTYRCECSSGFKWNGDSCQIECRDGKIPIRGVCACRQGLFEERGRCQSCPDGKFYDGTRCTEPECRPGYYWDGKTCRTNEKTCPLGTEWDGEKCTLINIRCPANTRWDGRLCRPTGGRNCREDEYWDGQICRLLPIRCPPNTRYENGVCVPNSGRCPPGTYLSGRTCVPYEGCQDGKIWNSDQLRCVCPDNSHYNGRTCVSCRQGQKYGFGGCFCPRGYFYNSRTERCQLIDDSNCRHIPNSRWVDGKCVCFEGFQAIGRECVCRNGLRVNDQYCDQCYKKPNSQWVNGFCRCRDGYYEEYGKCYRYGDRPGNNTNGVCEVGTYFDELERRCIACSDGCLSCISCYECEQCRPEYIFDFRSSLCIERCGDGIRYSSQCDDGNNRDGDGCSSDCKIELGYVCQGGSPNSADRCSRNKPPRVTYEVVGQSHLYGKIILNIRLNYLPIELINDQTECDNKCNRVLDAQIISGNRSVTSIVIRYITGTSYTFSLEFDFGREPIPLFKVRILIQDRLKHKYFRDVDISEHIDVEINPALLSLYNDNTEDILV